MDNKGPPPPYGMHSYPPLPPQDGTPFPTVSYTVHQSNSNVLTSVGPESCTGVCPSCHATISTRVEMTSTTKTHLIALLMCLIGCIPCCLIPYCMDSCQNINHYCPSCGAYIGSYKQ